MAEFAAARQPVQTRTSDPQRPSSSRVPRGPVSPTNDIGHLSRAVGNRTLHRLLRAHSVQPKIAVGPVDDEYEREADRVADDVMRLPDPSATPVQRTPLRVQRMCPECEAEEEKHVQRKGADVQRACPACEREKLHRHSEESLTGGFAIQNLSRGNEDLFVQCRAESGAGQSASIDASAMSGLDGGGRPLQEPTLRFFEGRMGHDFGAVRVHTDAAADKLARSVQAIAFAHGPHLVFRSGAYAPGTDLGRRLLAHELTHTIQQGASAAQRMSGAADSVMLSRTPAAPSVQRVCESTPPPPDLGCEPATSSTGSGTNIMFGLNSDALTPAQRSTLSAIAAGWHQGGQVAILRIDGFASCDGSANNNWRLSCRRAQTVARELEAPSDGSPGVSTANLQVVAHGETDNFDARALPPNRRAVITGGGTPPPGPPCALTVTGPAEVDHYCAAYVPSDAASCGVFPAPTIALTATGAAAGATVRWSIARGTSRASIVGAILGPTVTIRGDAASVSQGDVTVQVSDGNCTTPHFLTVRQPSQMTAAQAPTSGPTFIQTMITYTVSDQFGNSMGAGICVDETITICRTNRPRATPHFGDAPTDVSGQVQDQLQYSNTGGIPANLCIKIDQVLTAGGCGPLLHNTILFRPTGITLTHAASCAVGDPCP
jgi:outer membrane protein OmpA-like peptidoglycan-associated protein